VRSEARPGYPLPIMRVLVGTSGYSYKEWKGPFYPEKLPAKDFLRYYAERLATVEINNTFYRMPTAKLVEGWAGEAPETFTFAVKAPQRITHLAKLVDAAETTRIFVHTVSALGPRLGPLLFQLPPFLRKDVGRLSSFLDHTCALFDGRPGGHRIAFEFRHPSWSTTRSGPSSGRTALRYASPRGRPWPRRSSPPASGATSACARTSIPTRSSKNGRRRSPLSRGGRPTST
jgi:uncharacterized protein YecE (DUF72 family)